MDVSVIVPTCGRPKLLERCLFRLVRQAFDPGRYEIVVVDDGCSSATLEQVRAWAARHPLGPAIQCLATTGREGPAAARNLGCEHAAGAIIAFTDDDTLPDPHWLMCGLQAFASNIVAVSGRVVVPLPPEPTDYEYNESHLAEAAFVTANCFVRRDALRAVGGFETQFKMAWREDSDLHFKLLKYARRTGTRVGRADLAIVVHPVRPAPWAVSLRQQRKSQYNALLFKLHPDLYRSQIQSAPPWRYYAVVALALITVIAWVSGRAALTLAAATAWACLTWHFCSQRLRHTTHRPAHVLEMVVTSICIPFLSVFWRLVGAVRFRTPFL